MVFSQPKAPKKVEESDDEDDRKRKQLEGENQGTANKDAKKQDRVSSLKTYYLVTNTAKDQGP
jgi:hypothetical protein